MTGFEKLLLAVDNGPQAELLINRVSELYQSSLAKLDVVHVVKQGLHDAELLRADLCRTPHAQRVDDHLAIKIREMLRRNGLAINSDKIHLVRGDPAFEIKKLAKVLDSDLVIVGSHCHGNDWLSLPGATTNCVIQGISSDVMAVRI
ncbi:MAG: universal stress protein [Pseudohongiellaceae bacterium]